MATEISIEGDDGRTTTVLVSEPVPMVTKIVNDGRNRGDVFAALTGEDGKGVTINPLDVTGIREV